MTDAGLSGQQHAPMINKNSTSKDVVTTGGEIVSHVRGSDKPKSKSSVTSITSVEKLERVNRELELDKRRAETLAELKRIDIEHDELKNQSSKSSRLSASTSESSSVMDARDEREKV